jgi:hypothetical protein
MEEAVEIAELVVRFLLSLPTEPSLHFADVHGLHIHHIFGYLCSETPNRLPSFALWLAFPTSDYYDGSDAAQVSPPDLPGSVSGQPLTFTPMDSAG